jgi:NitT/TauT family transport system permease protein
MEAEIETTAPPRPRQGLPARPPAPSRPDTTGSAEQAFYAAQAAESARRWRSGVVRGLVALFALSTIVLLWWALAAFGGYPSYILPSPGAVAEEAWSMLADGSLPLHFGTTLLEAGLGFVLALAVGTVVGYLLAHSPIIARAVSPYIAISQGLPVVAIAPLLVLWVSDDIARKVIIVALIAFFPILVNTIVGLRGIDRSMLEVARISGANRLQTIRYVEMPLSLRAVLGGVRLGLMLSITGAVVGEFVSSDSGLGFLLMLGRGLFRTDIIFVGLVSLALLTLVIYAGVSLLERLLVTWD